LPRWTLCSPRRNAGERVRRSCLGSRRELRTGGDPAHVEGSSEQGRASRRQSDCSDSS
jgi:hypothetical protein